MTEKIILAAPEGPTRARLAQGFQSRGFEVIELRRETIVSDRNLLVDDEAIRLDGRDLTDGVDAALVLDSGYLFSMPMLGPTEAEWERHRENFDDYLRLEREGTSLWFTLLELIGDKVPRAINPQAAFAFHALKPHGLLTLAEKGVAVAPFVVSNDPDAFECLSEHKELRLSRLRSDASAEWIDRERLVGLPLDQEPALIHGLDTRELTEVIVAGAASVRAGGGEPLAEDAALARDALEALGACFGLVVLGNVDGRSVVVDFDLCPDLGALDDARFGALLDGLVRLMKTGEEPGR